ncbi:putative gustatory receptor 28b [Venturia canescens]|uniref:putative gustatory receptor 28b n=1 Tax=Venturia canescens TaxID=32260 RepID=UPI001C9D240D|nr:putative gustatory receptor 28b [Venturia canescens]
MFVIAVSGWIIGSGVIELPFGKRWPIASCIYSLLLLLGYCATSKVTLENTELVMISLSEITSLILSIAICVSICVVVCNTINGWKSIKGVQMIMERLEASGRRINELGIFRDYRFVYRRHLITLVVEIFCIVCIVVTAYCLVPPETETLWYEVATIVALHYPMVVICIGDATFITLVRSLHMRFAQLNKILKQLLKTSDDSPQHERVFEYTIFKRRNVADEFGKLTNDDTKLMRLASEDHYELVRIGSLINTTLGTQALLSMTLAFFFLIGLLYRASSLLLWSTDDKEAVSVEVVMLFSWVFFSSYRVISMTSACAQTSGECKETAVIICQLHEPSTSKAFRDEISDFLLQMTQHTVTFTACGLFTLDCSLIHGMIGSITTYLVILVQIGDTSNSSLPLNFGTPTSATE